MNRRNFLNSLIGGVAATAAVRTWPFRVFSFAGEISIGLCEGDLATFGESEQIFKIGKTITMRIPARFLNPKHAVLIEREVMAINSWNPATEQLIVTRGTMGAFIARSH